MLVLICGDRNWTNSAAIQREIEKLDQLDTEVVVMHGGARGADTIAGQLADGWGFHVKVFPAQWDRYSKAAGPFRNQQMLDQNPDLVLAFHADIEYSRGTKHMVKIARAKGVKVEVFKK